MTMTSPSNPNPLRILVPATAQHDLCKKCGRVVHRVALGTVDRARMMVVDCGSDIGGVMPMREALSHDGQQAVDGSGFLHDARLCQMEGIPDNSQRPKPTVDEAVPAKRR